MNIKYMKVPLCFLAIALFGVVVSGQSENDKSSGGLQSTLHQMMEQENIKIESIGAFLTALFTLIGLIPQAIVDVINAKINFDMEIVESVIKGLAGNEDTAQSIISQIREGIQRFEGGSSGGSGSIDIRSIISHFLGGESISSGGASRLAGGIPRSPTDGVSGVTGIGDGSAPISTTPSPISGTSVSTGIPGYDGQAGENSSSSSESSEH